MPVSAKGCFPRENGKSKFADTKATRGKITTANSRKIFYFFYLTHTQAHNQGGLLLPFNYRQTGTIVVGKKESKKANRKREQIRHYNSTTTNQATNQLTRQTNLQSYDCCRWCFLLALKGNKKM